jgi:hypothetical protein
MIIRKFLIVAGRNQCHLDHNCALLYTEIQACCCKSCSVRQTQWLEEKAKQLSIFKATMIQWLSFESGNLVVIHLDSNMVVQFNLNNWIQVMLVSAYHWLQKIFKLLLMGSQTNLSSVHVQCHWFFKHEFFTLHWHLQFTAESVSLMVNESKTGVKFASG